MAKLETRPYNAHKAHEGDLQVKERKMMQSNRDDGTNHAHFEHESWDYLCHPRRLRADLEHMEDGSIQVPAGV